jgi:hypothetical protein
MSLVAIAQTLLRNDYDTTRPTPLAITATVVRVAPMLRAQGEEIRTAISELRNAYSL